MDSAPRTSDLSGGATMSMGRAMTARMQPRLALSGALARHPRPGHLLRSTRSFGLRLGLSQLNRQLMDAAAGGIGSASVRPPIDYWPWAAQADEPTFESLTARGARSTADPTTTRTRAMIGAAAAAAPRVASPAPKPPPSKADRRVESLRRMLLGPRPDDAAGLRTDDVATRSATTTTTATVSASAPTTAASERNAPTVAPVVGRTLHRGLPMTPRRHGRTWAGDRTSPGGMATAAAPQQTASVAPSRNEPGEPEGLPAVTSSSVFDTSPRSGGSNTSPSSPSSSSTTPSRSGGPAPRSNASARPNVSREQQLRRMLQESGTIPRDPEPSGPAAGTASADVSSSRREATVLSAAVSARPVGAIGAGGAVGVLQRAVAAVHDAARPSPLAPRQGPIAFESPAAGTHTAGSLATLDTAPPTRLHVDINDDAVATSLLDPSETVLPRRGVSVADGRTSVAVSTPVPVAPMIGARSVVSTPHIERRPSDRPQPSRQTVDGLAGPTRRRHRIGGASVPMSGHGRQLVARSFDGRAVQWADGLRPAPAVMTVSAPDATVRRSAQPDARATSDARIGNTASRATTATPTPTDFPPHVATAREAPTVWRTRDDEMATAGAARTRVDSWADTVVDAGELAAQIAASRATSTPAPRAPITRPLERSIEPTTFADTESDTAVVAPPAAAGLVRPDVVDQVTNTVARSATPVPLQPPSTARTVQRSTAGADRRWVSAQPGTFFSSATGKGLLHRGTMLQRMTDTASDTVIDAPVAGSIQRAAQARIGIERAIDQPAGTVAAGTASIAQRLSTARQTLRRDTLTTIEQATPAAPIARRSAIERVGAVGVGGGDAGDVGGADVDVASAPPRPQPLADRFLTELSRHRQEAARPLPIQFRSVADAIVADRKPLISTSAASQRALAAVGKVAATMGDVIHLAAPLASGTPSREMTGVIAHELTHVANPSPAPRFFDDDRHSAEERQATEIGELMRRTPTRPLLAAGGINRMSSPHGTTVTHDASPTTIRRVVDEAPLPSFQETRNQFGGGGPQRPGASPNSSQQSAPARSDESSRSATPAIDPDDFTRLLRENFDLIVELLEDRLASDIERRGGRFGGDF